MKKRPLLFATTIGSTLEYYDLTIYALMAPIIAPLFFPNTSPQIQLLSLYGTYAFGFLARPLGGIVLGKLGDKYGRKFILLLTTMLMGGASLTIGMLPLYAQIGCFAPILLILCRLIQGFSAGAEYNGAALLLIESRGNSYLYRSGGLINMAVLAAPILGNLVSQWVSKPWMPSWGWRLPFLLGAFVALIGYYIRLKIPESKAFQEIQQKHGRLKPQPVSYRKVAAVTVIAGFGIMLFYTFCIYMSAFLKIERHWDSSSAYILTTAISVLIFLSIPFVCHYADYKHKGSKMMQAGALFFTLMSVPLFWVFENANMFYIILTLFPLSFFFALSGALLNGYMATLFPIANRFRGIALGYSLGATLIGGTAPMIYTFLIKVTGLTYAPGLYLSVVAFAAFLLIRYTKPHH